MTGTDDHNHPEIWLQPPCCGDPEVGRTWSYNNEGPCECGEEWIKYIRADLIAPLEKDASYCPTCGQPLDALEEAAQVAEDYPHNGEMLSWACERIAAAIRALKEKPRRERPTLAQESFNSDREEEQP